MSNHLKSIKEQIEKLAQVPTRGGGPKVKEPSNVPIKGQISVENPKRNVSPTNTGSGKVVTDKNVAEMQKAIQDLAKVVIKDSTSATMSLKNKDVAHEQAEDPVKKSKKAFNDFVAEQYIGSLSDELKGVEWTSSNIANTRNDKSRTQTDIYELDAVMNTLSRIGSERGEFHSDGNWGFRTDNALRNILGFAYALLQLEGDFGLNNNIYTTANWDEFKKLLSGYKVEGQKVLLSPQEKSSRALAITKHLQAINKLYDQFRKQVTARPEFRPFIEGQRSFDKYPGTGEALNPNEVALSKSNNQIKGITYIAPALPNRKLDFIPLKALTSKEEFMKWMVDYAGLDEANAIKVFDNVIKPKIEAL